MQITCQELVNKGKTLMYFFLDVYIYENYSIALKK